MTIEVHQDTGPKFHSARHLAAFETDIANVKLLVLGYLHGHSPLQYAVTSRYPPFKSRKTTSSERAPNLIRFVFLPPISSPAKPPSSRQRLTWARVIRRSFRRRRACSDTCSRN